MKIVRYYDDAFEAHVDRELLENGGITAVVLNENTGIVLPYAFVNPNMRIHIVVSDEDYPRAAGLLKLDMGNALREKNCPECGSTDIGFGFKGKSRFRRIILMYVLLPMAMAFSLPLGKIQRNYYCNHCRREFK